jgi:serine/threonine protein kinase
VLIDRYEVLGELGRGGMATIFLARTPDERLVVLKVPLSDDSDSCERLRDEARVGLRLAHPHIVETLDLVESDDRPVLVLSYVHGVSLYDLRPNGPMPTAAVLRIGRQLADALDAVHQTTDETGQSLGVVHRDVTAGNIMLGDDGNARLIDLGIARSSESRAARTRSGCMRGTLRYIAPELFDGEAPSPQSDLWALGIALLEAALGRPGFVGTDAAVVQKIIDARPLELLPGEWLDQRLLKALRLLLQPDPANRPTRARDVAALFSMYEKDFGDSQSIAASWAARALDEEHVTAEPADDDETRALLAHASRTYFHDADAREREERRLEASIHSAETEMWGGATDPQRFAGPPTIVEPPRELTPHEAILSYASQLRAFECGAPPERHITSSEFSIS